LFFGLGLYIKTLSNSVPAVAVMQFGFNIDNVVLSWVFVVGVVGGWGFGGVRNCDIF